MIIKNWLKNRLRRISKLYQVNVESILLELVDQSNPGTIFTCNINGMELLAPVELLRICPHCLTPQAEHKLTYFVETSQSEWLCSKLKPGDIAIDIGAAFGVITAALSKSVGETGKVYAFEPSKRAQGFLQQLLDLNNIENVTVVKAAISDTPGSTEFIEYTPDNELSWASDASTLAAASFSPTLKHTRYPVDVTTLDEFVASQGIHPKAIKMDIEGFEFYALQGSIDTLEKFHPYLCIDIHKDVVTEESTLDRVKPYLSELGYKLEMQGHALYCTPKQA
jgi:FkbM family methyltransferase